jgi:cytochrome P450
VQNKLRGVIKAAFPDAISESRQPTAKEIIGANVPYLEAVMEECMRYSSLTPIVAREAIVDTVLLGHRIPKGTSLYICSTGPGYQTKPVHVNDSARSETSRTKHWGGEWDPNDLHTFNPERWLKMDGDGEVVYDAQAGPFLTFSLGPRGCFGRRLAYLEMRMVLTLLVWSFRFKKLEGEIAKYDKVEGITVVPKFCYVGLERI